MRISEHTPTPKFARLSPLRSGKAGAESAQSMPSESVELSAPAKEDASGAVRAHAKGLGPRLLGVLGLGLVGLTLAGCGGGNQPTPTPPNQQQQQTQASAKSYTQRLEQLRSQSDKTGYYQMAEAGYQQAILQRFAAASDPASKEVQDLAKKALEAFDYNADPAAQQKLMRDVMQAIAQIKSDAPEVTRFTQAAQASLQIGQAFSDGAAQAPGGIVGQVKSRAYEEGFKSLLQRLKQAPDQLKDQSGYDPALIRNYVESLSIAPEVALEFGPQLGDPGLSAVLYGATGDVVYQRIKTDGGVLGGQVTAAIQLIQNLRQSLGF